MILSDEERLAIWSATTSAPIANGIISDFARRIEREVAERCAKVCDERQEEGHDDGIGPAICAAAIRAMIEPKQKRTSPQTDNDCCPYDLSDSRHPANRRRI